MGLQPRPIAAGCWFSINGAEVARPKVLGWLPPERVLTETDFPLSRRQDPAACTPGAVMTIESALAELWQRSVTEVGTQLWMNLHELVHTCGSAGRLPRGIQALLLSLPERD
jgi:Tat protein secretion system quality control protein TatD with DNase activity